MKAIFLGTNGWFANKFANTTCTFLEGEKFYIVFDAGDGIYKLDRYIKKNKPIFLFLSHLHLDHIIGFHTFPKFKFKNKITVFLQQGNLKKINCILNHPYAAPIKDIKLKINFQELNKKTKLPFLVNFLPLAHIDPTLGYRIELDGKKIAYCSDTGICENSLILARGVDLLIHECFNRPQKSSGIWGHTNPEEAADLALRANVKKMALIHFSPEEYKNLKERKIALETARKIFSKTIITKDDLEITI